jgi:hypothetical protein
MVWTFLVPWPALSKLIEGGKPVSNTGGMLVGDAGRLDFQEFRLDRNTP